MAKRKNPYQPITLEQAIETMTKVRDFYRDNPRKWARTSLVKAFDPELDRCGNSKDWFDYNDNECYCIVGACHVFTPNRPALPKNYENGLDRFGKPVSEREQLVEVLELVYANPVLDWIIPFFPKTPTAVDGDYMREPDGRAVRAYVYDYNDSDAETVDELIEKLDEIIDGLKEGQIDKPVSEYVEEVVV